ncbi:MAG TPA: hypothetical protein DHV69_04750 [Sphaerochaeta sp.]|jgi:hypothetical protein|nr:DUF3185 family protein [Sphaerochaeta sp.]OHD29357.1 MAG: hypothetical protein A2Y31_09520 [Spirochaetes bacterium GWC2_52_13]PKL12901.1 MAG: hypothetical protein CVV52_08180 [Spirochaetae bacterium HGW-Spirochaetae-8]PKL22406.1 MAG: hypothetical protein CVV48_02880 [Spirochaetae bacterium HGW-Spirochaetae-4]HCG63188.1 hypothetical protein [Sphaerochaeta sp.]
MGVSRIFGILLVVGGGALIVAGYFASRSVSDSVRTFFGASFTKETLWYFIGGAAAVVSGLFVLVGSRS